jgi:serine/threonine protein kinase
VEKDASFIDALADEFLQRYRRGERPRIAEYIARYPDHADAIRELLPSLVMLESLARGKSQGSRYSVLSGVRRPEILGDYRILQEVGQGGMGIVYEAEQISLGRHVALKILPFQLARNPRAVERFQREARAVAKLQHPHIVPVIDCGEEDSVFFYAMQFVHGLPVSDVLDEVRKLQGTRAIDLARWAGQTTDLAISLLEAGADGKADTTADESTSGDFQPFSSDDCPGTNREARVREIIDDCLLRSERGEPIVDEQIIGRHPDLQSDLEDELRMLRLIQASRLPSLVEDLTALETKWHSSEEEDSKAERDCGHVSSVSDEFRISSVITLTGEQDLTSAGRQRHYFRSVVRLCLDVAGALAYAHEQGVVHRDIKPSNLMLDTRGRVWVTDFGLAKLEGAGCTSSKGFVGTLRYTSPEQIHGRCDERSDVYGLGMTLYEMITLTLPFREMDNVELIHHVCHRGPLPPREIEPAIPSDLETIILKAIARHPSDRYQSAQELSDDLVRFLEHQPIAAKRSGRLARAWKWIERLVRPRASHARLTNGAVQNAGDLDDLRRQISILEAENTELREKLARADRYGHADAVAGALLVPNKQ